MKVLEQYILLLFKYLFFCYCWSCKSYSGNFDFEQFLLFRNISYFQIMANIWFNKHWPNTSKSDGAVYNRNAWSYIPWVHWTDIDKGRSPPLSLVTCFSIIFLVILCTLPSSYLSQTQNFSYNLEFASNLKSLPKQSFSI